MNNLNEMVANEATNLVTGNLRSDIHQLVINQSLHVFHIFNTN